MFVKRPADEKTHYPAPFWGDDVQQQNKWASFFQIRSNWEKAIDFQTL